MDKIHFSSILTMKEMNLRFTTIADNSDELSAVLIVHLMCEKILEIWIEASTHNKKFFNNTGNITFNNKLQIAKNFSLPEESYDFMKALNSIRNKFAHQIEKTKISDSEIEILYKSISNYIKKHPNQDPMTCRVRTKSGNYAYSDSNNIKITLIFSCVYLLILEDINLLVKQEMKENN